MAWPELLAQRFSLLRSCLSSLYSDFRRDGAHTSPAPLKIRGSATPSLHLLPHGTSGKEAELLKNGKKAKPSPSPSLIPCERTARSHAGAHAARGESIA